MPFSSRLGACVSLVWKLKIRYGGSIFLSKLIIKEIITNYILVLKVWQEKTIFADNFLKYLELELPANSAGSLLFLQVGDIKYIGLINFTLFWCLVIS